MATLCLGEANQEAEDEDEFADMHKQQNKFMLDGRIISFKKDDDIPFCLMDLGL